MFKKKIIARISNGFGNQLFLYATSYAFARSLHYKLLLDIKSGFRNLGKFENKNAKHSHYLPKFELSVFNLSSSLAPDSLCFNSKFGNVKRKFFSILNPLVTKKRFIREKRDHKKNTRFNKNILNNVFNDTLYVEGYYESERYFLNYRTDLLNEFTFRSPVSCNHDYLKLINNSNSVSIALRRNRFSETFTDSQNDIKVNKSKMFDIEQSKYILNSINFFKKKIDNPTFFIFSDDFTDIEKLIPNNKNIHFISDFNTNKIVEDFYLMLQCKHFIVGPTTFHWWAAWLSKSNNTICVRPQNAFLNPSSNSDFWPSTWSAV